MLVKDIVKIIEKKAPVELAYDWDNSGLLCGDADMEVKKIYLTLNTDIYTVNEAAALGADMIVSHHPIMFGGIKKIDYSEASGKIIKSLIQNNIALYASHTPMDTANEGLNDVLAQKLGLINTEIIEKNSYMTGCGLGRVGDIERIQTLSEFAKTVKNALDTPFVRVSGDPGTVIKRAAVGAGACSELIPYAKAMGAQVMVTADMKYHTAIDAVESGICVIDAGHYPTEKFVTEIFGKLLNNCGCELIYSTEKDIFSVL